VKRRGVLPPIGKPSQAPDLGVFLTVLGLVTFGWVMVYSTSAILGFAGLLVTLQTPYQKWQRWAWPLFSIGVSLLGLVLAIGHQVGGAKRWLKLGLMGFQPSEPMKIITIMALADFLDKHKSDLRFFWRGFVPATLIFLIPAGITLKEPDLGTCILIAATGFVMVYMAGAKGLHSAAFLGTGSLGVILLVAKASYRMHRVVSFLNPWKDPKGSGYQLAQSLLALGSGGVWGKGLGNSELKIHYLPDAHTDFIFSILGEELGLLGTLFLIILFAALAVRGFQVAQRAPDLFGNLVATGVVFLTSFQALIHLAVSVGLAPTKGIPLPFLSYGGSSLVVMLSSFGILLKISRYSSSSLPKRYRS